MSNIIVSSGQVSSGIIVSSWNSMTVLSSGTATATTVNSGGDMYVSSGGTATDTIVKGGSMYIYSGGTATATTVKPDGYLHVCGTANTTTVNSSGWMYVDSGGTANTTTVNSNGWMEVSSGGTANDTIINSGGWMYVSSGGTANDTTVNSNGWMEVSSGGTATIAFNPWQGWNIFTEDGAFVSYLKRDADVYVGSSSGLIRKADTFSEMTIGNGISALVYSGGSIEDCRLQNGGTMEIFSGSEINGFAIKRDLIVSDTLVLNDVTVSGRAQITDNLRVSDVEIVSGGRVMIGEFASGSDFSVMQGASLFVLGGGVAENVTVTGGGAYVMGGGEIKGDIEISQSGGLYLYGGSIVNGDIRVKGLLYVDEDMVSNGDITVDLNSSAMIENLDNLGDLQNFTVDATACSFGSYVLASGAVDYDGTVTVQNDEESCELAIGETEKIKGDLYTLSLSDTGILTMAVFDGDDSVPPVLKSVSGSQAKGSYRIDLKVKATDNIGVTEYQVSCDDKTVTVNADQPWFEVSSTDLGKKSFTLKAFDAAGNASNAKNFKVTVKDYTAPVWKGTPELVVESEINSKTKGGLSWTAAYDNVKVTKYTGEIYSVETGKKVKSFSTSGSSVQLSAMAAGNYTLYLTAQDAAKNKSSVQTFNFTSVDRTAPVLKSVKAAQEQDSYRVNLAIKATDNVGVTRYELTYGGTTQVLNMANPYFEVSKTAVGTVKYTLTAYDAMNNSCAKNYSVKIKDVTPPEWSEGATSEIDDMTQKGGILSWDEASDNVGVKKYTVTVYMGSKVKNFTSTTTEVNLKGLTPGVNYSCVITAQDAAKNVSETFLEGNFSVADVNNNTFKKATKLKSGNEYEAILNSADEVDFYSFDKATSLDLAVSNGSLTAELQDAGGNTVSDVITLSQGRSFTWDLADYSVTAKYLKLASDSAQYSVLAARK